MELSDFEKIKYLDERLTAYGISDFYPFHMPGHKRIALENINPYKIDITEIEGFDNLHHAEEILLQSQNRLCSLYKSRRSYYLINGSTCGIISAIGAVTNAGEEVIIARNCHKAVYNAVKIFNLKVNYVYPKQKNGKIQEQILAEEVEKTLKNRKSTKLVVITSPTYEGYTSNIRKIADITHKYNAYLIVDEAHGAHFSFHEAFPESALTQGADLVIQSLHKTLPSFTQTAVLHVNSQRVDTILVEEMLGIFQTSSPSYILMAGIDCCVRMLEKKGRRMFEEFVKRLEAFYERCQELQCLSVIETGGQTRDISKLVICTCGTEISGEQLYQTLLHTYHIQMEMYSAHYVLAMTSIMDTQEGFDRLLMALFKIDKKLLIELKKHIEKSDKYNIIEETDVIRGAYAPREKVLELGELAHCLKKDKELKKCAGDICAEYIYLYPPGIPMIVPGERITTEFIRVLEQCRKLGLKVQGTKDKEYRMLQVVNMDKTGGDDNGRN